MPQHVWVHPRQLYRGGLSEVLQATSGSVSVHPGAAPVEQRFPAERSAPCGQPARIGPFLLVIMEFVGETLLVEPDVLTTVRLRPNSQ